MKAFECGISKEEFVAEQKKHQEMDRFVRRTYGNANDMNGFDIGDFEGCAVGCALATVAMKKKIKINTSNHKEFETHLGIPEWLARVEDKIFETVSKARSRSWPVEFAEAINQGADLDKVKAPFLIFILESTLDKFDHVKYPKVKKAVDDVIQYWKTGQGNPVELRAAAYAAYGAYAADAAAAAAYAYAADATYAAADAVAYAAAYAAAAAKSSQMEKFADKLLELLRECK